MHPRYTVERIGEIYGDAKKTGLWDETELAAIRASEELGEFPEGVFQEIHKALSANPVDLEWWLARDKVIHHDLNAYLEERMRHISTELQKYFHRKMTSYDTEESAFVRMLSAAVELVYKAYSPLDDVLVEHARAFRYTAMIGRSHGQGGDVQTQGKRALTWLVELREAMISLAKASEVLDYSRLSGAMGNYGGMNPDVEKWALGEMGLKPFYGATQIMPRSLYVPLAASLTTLGSVIEKIALDIRLGARSPHPIYQEPFGKKQKGSSAMPHKRNTILSEKLMGMGRMARGYLTMLVENVVTWEERAIEQSSVERVAWPDLFHVTLHSLDVITKVLKGLNVYPDNMMLELVQSRGCYAASQAKELLKDWGHGLWDDAEEAYRIVQLAAFNVFEPSDVAMSVRTARPNSFELADQFLINPPVFESAYLTIKEVIAEGRLRVSENLQADEDVVERWNEILRSIFRLPENRLEWEKIFSLSVLLKNENVLFQQILGE